MGDFPLEEEHQQYQLPFEDLPSVSQLNHSPKSKKRRKTPARTLEAPVFSKSSSSEEKQEQLIEGIPEPTLPTRWEGLQDKIGSNTASMLTIIRPIPEAMKVVDDIVRYIKTTGGCQLLVVRADTGSGKTTFLKTLPHYMKDVHFCVIRNLAKTLWTYTCSNRWIKNGVLALIYQPGEPIEQSEKLFLI